MLLYILNKPIQLKASTAGFTALQNCQKSFQLILTVDQLGAVLTADYMLVNFQVIKAMQPRLKTK